MLGHIDGLSESELRKFLKADESSVSITMSLSSGTTAIRQTQCTDEKEAYFMLNGQRVDNPTKGIYIKNGKKVII